MNSVKSYHFFLVLSIAISALHCKQSQKEVEPVPGISAMHTKMLIDTVDGEEILLVGNRHASFLIAFYTGLENGTKPILKAVQGRFPVILSDEQGGNWNVFGECVSGPNKGMKLEMTDQILGYWFSFSSMFPGIPLQGAESIQPGELPSPSEGWEIPHDLVFRGQFKDAIIALEEPEFMRYRQRDHLQEGFYVPDAELVTGVYYKNEWLLVPHNVLNWHEIVNLPFDDQYLTIAYCPLTGTSRAWGRENSTEEKSFGVSGLLFNNNMILYDRETDSRWVQLLDKCVNGVLKGSSLEPVPVMELTWQSWKSALDQPLILSGETGYAIDYNNFPYGDYKTDHQHLLFPLIFDDYRLDTKERVLMVQLENARRVYSFESLE